MQSNFSLSFLEELQPEFTDQDVEEVWRDRTFPLVCTEDFSRNWCVVLALEGVFVTPSGVRCNVRPQPHYESRCKAFVYEDGSAQQKTIPYDAIIFAKVLHQISLNSGASKPVSNGRPAQVERRQYIDHHVSKLPKGWRELVTQCDLHQYEEHTARIPESIDTGLYTPLASPKNIRLITLLSCNDPNTPIECTMQEASFAKGPEYEALSYVWGSPTPQRTVTLNGRNFPVGENLEAALRQLRPCGENKASRTIWIDAMCINQLDVEERTQQVSQMDMVYRGAARVVVWLGRESNTSARVFRELKYWRKNLAMFKPRQISQILRFPFQNSEYCAECDAVPRPDTLRRYYHAAKQAGKVQVEERLREYLKLAENPRILPQVWKDAHIDLIESFIKLLARPWWKRVWVLQEVILARKLILHCGPESVDWQIFQIALYTMIRQAKRSRIYHSGGLSSQARESKAQAMLVWSANHTFAFFFFQSASLYAHRARDFTMASLLSLTSVFEATDARDKLFALVGLLPEASRERLAFKPDYTTNVRRLYIRVAKHFLQTTQRLDIITARPQQPYHYKNKYKPEPYVAGPSWVPNWKQPQFWMYNSIWISHFSAFETFNRYMDDRNEDDSCYENHHCGHDHNSASDESLHTGDECGPAAQPREDGLQLFNASLCEISPFPFEFTACDEILHARGIPVDTIEEVGPAWDLVLAATSTFRHGDRENSRLKANEAQISIIENWKAIARMEEVGVYPYTNQTRPEAFWRTLLLDRYRHQWRAVDIQTSFRRIPSNLDKEEVPDLFGGQLHTFPPEDKSEEQWLIWYLRHEVTEMWTFGNVNLHCANLRFFRTVKGYIGVSHPNARPGDTVAVLLGAPIPLVLREYAEGHLVVGQSYVHGIMDGEIIQAEVDQGRGVKKEDFQVFNII